MLGGLTPYVAGGTAAGFTNGVLNETNDWVKGESFDVDTVAGETLVRGVFAAMGGAAPVVNNIFTGTVTKEAQHLDMIAGIAGGFWTENLKEMTEHGIKPPSLWPALPSR